jgi:predicted N-acetyltransferase YhbS
MSSIVVRPACLDDRADVVAVVRAAFTSDVRDGEDEIDILERTWALASMDGVIDLVAVGDGSEVIGHVIGAPGVLGTGQLLAVAPLAVSPVHHRRGVGSSLMGELIGRADDAGWPAVVLLGDPNYYRRFGFEHAGRVGVTYSPVGADSPYFQIRRLRRYTPSLRGSFVYHWEVSKPNGA